MTVWHCILLINNTFSLMSACIKLLKIKGPNRVISVDSVGLNQVTERTVGIEVGGKLQYLSDKTILTTQRRKPQMEELSSGAFKHG